MNSVVMSETRMEIHRRIESYTKDEELLHLNRNFRGYDECVLGAAYLKTGRVAKGLRELGNGLRDARSKARAVRLVLSNLVPLWAHAVLARVRRRF